MSATADKRRTGTPFDQATVRLARDEARVVNATTRPAQRKSALERATDRAIAKRNVVRLLADLSDEDRQLVLVDLAAEVGA